MTQIGLVEPTNENPVSKNRHLSTWYGSKRQVAFRLAVRDRDKACVLTGKRPPRPNYPNWKIFEAAQIVPMAQEMYWIDMGFDDLIEIPPAGDSEADSAINSIQNGMLLSREVHVFFDDYDVSINPDVYITNRARLPR